MFAKQPTQRQNENKRIVAKPAAAKGIAGRAMAVPNAKASQANRRALGDIGNLVADLSSRCNINKEGVADGGGANLAVNGNKVAGSSTQQSQAESIIVRPEAKVEARAVWGNKQRRSNRRKKDRSASVLDESVTDSSATVEVVGGVGHGKPRKTLTATLTARSEAACRGFEDPVPSIDLGDLDNQLAVVEYVEDIYEFYRKTENLSCVPPDYMSRQAEVTGKMRGILIDWLVEVHLKFELMPETLYLATNIIDRYLSVKSVATKMLQLVGITAMLIACKYEEIWAPEINDFVSISAGEYSGEQIVAMEHMILNQLKFNLTVPTPYVFLVRFLKAARCDKEMENFAFFLVELCLTHYVMVKYSPSMLAAAAVYTAQCTLNKDLIWDTTLILHTGYSEADLQECARLMVTFHINSGRSRLKNVHKKYSDPLLNSVALLSPANLPADNSCNSSSSKADRREPK